MCVSSFRVVVHVKATLGKGHDNNVMDAEAGFFCGDLGSNEVGAALDAAKAGQSCRAIIPNAEGIELGGSLHANDMPIHLTGGHGTGQWGGGPCAAGW